MPAENSPLRSTPEWVELRDAEAVRILLSHKQRQALTPFMGQTQSVAGAARITKESPNTVLKRVQRWLEVGLLVEESGDGKVKLYRAAALSFFVPQQIIGRFDLERLLEQLDAHEAGLMRQGQLETALSIEDWGLRFWIQDDQDWTIQPARTGLTAWNYYAPEAPALLAETDLLHLSKEEAKQLQRELVEVLRKFSRRAGKEHYLVRVAMSPLADTIS